MKTVGEILKEARIKKTVSFDQIEKVIKIRKKYLKSLEENKFARIGSATTVKGFIKNYGKYLGLKSSSLVAVFRRDYTENKGGQIVLRGMTEPLNKQKFIWTPKHTFVAAILLILVFFVIFLGWHLFSLWSSR